MRPLRSFHSPRFGVGRAVGAALLAAGGAPLAGSAAAAQQAQAGQRARGEVRIVQGVKAQLDTLTILFREIQGAPYDAPETQIVLRQIDSLMPRMLLFVTRRPSVVPAMPRGWLGIKTQGPNVLAFTTAGEMVQYFDYPQIVSVDPASPAEHAGIAPGDLLLAYNGQDVRGRAFNLTRLLEPDQQLAVTVQRGGESREYKILIPRSPLQEMPAGLPDDAGDLPMAAMLASRAGSIGGEAPVAKIVRRGDVDDVLAGRAPSARGVMRPMPVLVSAMGAMFGASFVTVSGDMARALKIDSGVVANEVAEGAQFWHAGLRAGDRVVAVAGRPVASFRDMNFIIATLATDRSVALDVVRDKKALKLTLTR
jgi:S1-C subfamily serine protease